MSSPGSQRWLRRGLVAVAVLLVVLGGAVAVLLLHSPGNVSHPNVEFTRPSSTPPPTQAALPAFEWPNYGYNAARTREFDPPSKLGPPFRKGWRFQDFALLEFPPVINGHTLFVLDDDGSAKAIDALNGHKLWETKVGTLAAASPALGIAQGLLYLPILSTNASASKTQAPGHGKLVALSMKTGRVVWSHDVPPGTESSPLAWQNSVYFGDQNGTVYSLDAQTGHVNWTYHASGAVKGGPSLAYGRLYFGDYSGRAYALNPTSGHKIWAVNTGGADFGFGSGNFYSTPAVAFGRVYMGNTDGRVYSFAARTGQLAWATGTGAYVYASPAVADLPGIGPTVYEGSYDGYFYAFNAQSGAIRWRHPAGGKISGSATIVGDIVYFSDLAAKNTQGLDARTGRRVFLFPDGAFNPVVADSSTIYLTGYTMLYQMIPKRSTLAAASASSASGRRNSAQTRK
ncbi:MAG TPA: PQQ-binding-like beta-propeller repeat protein [Solirubrobacteraceae bacterium]|nr:PQQ-binding-like beta-propeller repeat protein [Solirubrobacteraceae bacterium]